MSLFLSHIISTHATPGSGGYEGGQPEPSGSSHLISQAIEASGLAFADPELGAHRWWPTRTLKTVEICGTLQGLNGQERRRSSLWLSPGTCCKQPRHPRQPGTDVWWPCITCSEGSRLQSLQIPRVENSRVLASFCLETNGIIPSSPVSRMQIYQSQMQVHLAYYAGVVAGPHRWAGSRLGHGR